MNNEKNIEQKIFNNMIICMKKYIHFKGVYQKVKAIKELYTYYNNYSSFLKGKQEGSGAADDYITNIFYTISKTFPKNIFLITKFANLFYISKYYLGSLKASLSILTNEILKNNKGRRRENE